MRFTGLLCGLAIYNFTIINLPFPLVLYKKLLAEPVLLDDLDGLCPTTMRYKLKCSFHVDTKIFFVVSSRSLHSLLEYEGEDFEDVFCLSFVVSRELFGSLVTSELKPGGTNIIVTQKNKLVNSLPAAVSCRLLILLQNPGKSTLTYT